MPKVRSSNKGRGKRRTRERQSHPREVKTMPSKQCSEREEVDFMLDLCQGALCEELSLETEVECFGEGRQPICWSLVGLEHCHGG
jgi:hypothetical protein